MFTKPTLYKHYITERRKKSLLPDITSKVTLERINQAINLCDYWDNFMDIGAGNGHYALALSHIFKSGTMVEVEKSEEHPRILREYKNIKIFNDVIENYKNTTTKFDFIFLADIFEHIPDIYAFIDQLSNIQKIGSVVYIMTPNPIFCGPASESEIYFKNYSYGHIKHYTKNEIVNIMKEKGYELIFHAYEETIFRQKAKIIYLVDDIYKRGSMWKKIILFNPISLLVLKFLYVILEKITYMIEIKNSNNPSFTMTQDFAFKKINK